MVDVVWFLILVLPRLGSVMAVNAHRGASPIHSMHACMVMPLVVWTHGAGVGFALGVDTEGKEAGRARGESEGVGGIWRGRGEAKSEGSDVSEGIGKVDRLIKSGNDEGESDSKRDTQTRTGRRQALVYGETGTKNPSISVLGIQMFPYNMDVPTSTTDMLTLETISSLSWVNLWQCEAASRHCDGVSAGEG